MNASPHPKTRRTNSSVLVGLLWCVALLSVVVVGLLHTSRIDLMIEKNYGDRIQAHYLAVAGIEKTKALLYRDARERSRNGKNHTGQLYNSPQDFQAVSFSRGHFRIFRPGTDDEGGGTVYGVSDEESRLNLNSATFEQLSNIDGLTPDVAAAIIDWRDADNEVTPGGAEADYYASLRPPYLPRNGPLQTVRELLMVRGITPELLLGSRSRQTGQTGEEDTSDPVEPDTGWAPLLTVNSSVDNVSGTGQERLNIQTADENALTAIHGITADIAKAIIAYRNQNRFESVINLLDVTAVQNQGQQGNPAASQSNPADPNSPPGGANPNQPVSDPSGPKVISQELLMDIADELTVQDGRETPGAININTASLDVLICLPGITRPLAHSIISYRRSSGFFPNVACLLRVPEMTTDILKQVAPLLSVRSETFRILCEGRIDSSRVSQRIQEIVHIGLHSVTTVSYREDDL